MTTTKTTSSAPSEGSSGPSTPASATPCADGRAGRARTHTPARAVVSARDVSLAGELGLLRQTLAAAARLLEPSAVGEDLPADSGREVLAVISLAEARRAASSRRHRS